MYFFDNPYVVNFYYAYTKESLITSKHSQKQRRITMCVCITYPNFIYIQRAYAGESETFLQKAIQEQGRGQVLDTIYEIQERHDGVKAMERNLNELHQVFLDMAVLVEAQGEQLDDIQGHVDRASSFVQHGNQQLQKARFYQKNTRKWTCYGILILLVIVGIILASTLTN